MIITSMCLARIVQLTLRVRKLEKRIEQLTGEDAVRPVARSDLLGAASQRFNAALDKAIALAEKAGEAPGSRLCFWRQGARRERSLPEEDA